MEDTIRLGCVYFVVSSYQHNTQCYVGIMMSSQAEGSKAAIKNADQLIDEKVPSENRWRAALLYEKT